MPTSEFVTCREMRSSVGLVTADVIVDVIDVTDPASRPNAETTDSVAGTTGSVASGAQPAARSVVRGVGVGADSHPASQTCQPSRVADT